MTQWKLEIPDQTDAAVRAFLARSGQGEATLAQFVDQAVRSEMLRRTVGEIHAQNADRDPQEIERLVDEAVQWARENRS